MQRTSWPDVLQLSYSCLEAELKRRVLERTGRRVHDLRVEVGAGAVTLGGVAPSFHVKQLAQHAAFDLLPDVAVENAISVEDEWAAGPLREKTTKVLRSQ